MTITKKHLKELADIVYKLSKNGDHDNAQELEGFARRHAPNFDQSRWDDHIYKRQKEDELANLITRQDELRANNQWNTANDLSPRIAGLKRSLGISGR